MNVKSKSTPTPKPPSGACRWVRVCAIGVVMAALFPITAASAGAWTIDTFAGSAGGLHGFSGDGGPATAALLEKPEGVAVDAQGNVFIADSGNNRVRRVGLDGTISTVAGSGVSGYLGDGGPATSARITAPTGLAVDGAGNLFISDCTNDVVRRVAPAGTITTVAGQGTQGFSGDGGPGTAAKLHCPLGLAIDGSNNLFIADRDNNRVRKLTASGTITTVAGNGSGTPSGDGGPATSAGVTPFAVAITADGGLLLADAYHGEVRQVSPGGTIAKLAGTFGLGQFNSGDGGPASAATLDYPAGIAVDAAGNAFIATECRVREVDAGGTITTIAGTENCGLSGDGCLATEAEFTGAHGGVPVPLALSGTGTLLLADYSSNNVRAITPGDVGSCTAASSAPGATPAGPANAKPPVVRILSGPPAETAAQKATFTFKGVAGGTYECSIDNGAWSPCKSGQSFGPLAPGDHRFQVRETLAGLTGPADSYSWTIALPRKCVLRVARARVFVHANQHRVRLVIRYKTYRPADVTVSYRLAGSRGALFLGSASKHFNTVGVSRLPVALSKQGVAKVRATKSMTVKFKIPRTPSSCGRYYTKRLTIPKLEHGQTVWFQSDSIFAPAG